MGGGHDPIRPNSASPVALEAIRNRRATVRAVVFDHLRAQGVDKIFGNPGSTELPMFVDLPDDFDYVLGLQESLVVAIADGHAKATGRPAFVNCAIKSCRRLCMGSAGDRQAPWSDNSLAPRSWQYL